MTFDEKELDNAINKIIVTSLFSCLSDTQQKQFLRIGFQHDRALLFLRCRLSYLKNQETVG